MTLCVMSLVAAPAELAFFYRYAEWHFFVILLGVVLLSVVILCVVAPRIKDIPMSDVLNFLSSKLERLSTLDTSTWKLSKY
jgi:hypothetical protein